MKNILAKAQTLQILTSFPKQHVTCASFLLWPQMPPNERRCLRQPIHLNCWIIKPFWRKIQIWYMQLLTGWKKRVLRNTAAKSIDASQVILEYLVGISACLENAALLGWRSKYSDPNIEKLSREQIALDWKCICAARLIHQCATASVIISPGSNADTVLLKFDLITVSSEGQGKWHYDEVVHPALRLLTETFAIFIESWQTGIAALSMPKYRRNWFPAN